MRAWDALYFTEGEFRPDPNQSAEWNRGAYLVKVPVIAAPAIRPRRFSAATRTINILRGSYLQGWSSPDITNDARLGLGRWSKEDIVAYLRSGHNRITAATAPMGEVVTLSTSHMTDPDLNAIATYLKSLPGKNDGSLATGRERATDGRRSGDLSGPVLGLPRPRWQRRGGAVSVHRRFLDGAVG